MTDSKRLMTWVCYIATIQMILYVFTLFTGGTSGLVGLSLFAIELLFLGSLMLKGNRLFRFGGKSKMDYARKVCALHSLILIGLGLVLGLAAIGLITLPAGGVGLVPLIGAIGVFFFLALAAIPIFIYEIYCLFRFWVS